MANLGAIGGFLQGFTQTFQQMQRLQIEKRRAELAGREAASNAELRGAQISRLEELKKNDENTRANADKASQLAQDRHLQSVAEFEANFGLGEQSMGLRERQVENAEEMTDAQIADLKAKGLHRDALMGLSTQRFHLDQDRQAADISARTRSQDVQESQFGQSFGLDEKGFELRKTQAQAGINAQKRGQDTQESQFGQTLDLQKEELGLKKSKTASDAEFRERQQSTQESQFDRSIAADESRTRSAESDRSKRTSLAQQGVDQSGIELANQQARVELGVLQERIDKLSLIPPIARTPSNNRELAELKASQRSILDDMSARVSTTQGAAPSRTQGVQGEESMRAGSQGGAVDEIVIHAPPFPGIEPDLTDEQADRLEAVGRVRGVLEDRFGKSALVNGQRSYVVSDNAQAEMLRESPLYAIDPLPVLTTEQVQENDEQVRIDTIDTMNEAGEALRPVVNNLATNIAAAMGIEVNNETPGGAAIQINTETVQIPGKSQFRSSVNAKGEPTESRTTDITTEEVPRLHIGDTSQPHNLKQLAAVVDQLNASGMSGDTFEGWLNLVADQGADIIETGMTMIPSATEPIAGSLVNYRFKPYNVVVSKPTFNTVNKLVQDARTLSHPSIGDEPVASFRDSTISEVSLDFGEELAKRMNEVPGGASAGFTGPGSRGQSRKQQSPADVNQSVEDRASMLATTVQELAVAFEIERQDPEMSTRHAVQTIRDKILLMSEKQQRDFVSHRIGGTVNPKLMKTFNVLKEAVGIDTGSDDIPSKSIGNLLINGRPPRKKQILPFSFINTTPPSRSSVGGRIQ